MYTSAMAEVARRPAWSFVDLFAPSQALYQAGGKPLTINGVHLNEEGDRQLAQVIDARVVRRRWRGAAAKRVDAATLEKLRQAVLDKNFTWFERYRTTDGYSIFGGRADLKFVDDQTNREVMQREMEVLDVMTANRDRRIWAGAQGSDLAVDDSNTPPFIEVITNKPGPLPGGKHVFLSRRGRSRQDDRGQGNEGHRWWPTRRCFPSWSIRCRWPSTPRAGCGSPPGRAIRTGSPRRR